MKKKNKIRRVLYIMKKWIKINKKPLSKNKKIILIVVIQFVKNQVKTKAIRIQKIYKIIQNQALKC